MGSKAEFEIRSHPSLGWNFKAVDSPRIVSSMSIANRGIRVTDVTGISVFKDLAHDITEIKT